MPPLERPATWDRARGQALPGSTGAKLLVMAQADF